MYDLKSGRLHNPDHNVTAGLPGVNTTEYVPRPPEFRAAGSVTLTTVPQIIQDTRLSSLRTYDN
jgi:hypothetical protein